MEKEKKPDREILILCVILAASVIGLLVVLLLPARKGEFIPPEFEAMAESGVPEVPDGLGYTELFQDGMAYRVGVCGIPSVSGDVLTTYFTNPGENECYLKLRILDEKDEVIGETGLLRPNEYVKDVSLTGEQSSGTPIRLKVMSYDAATYESKGSVILSVTTGESVE